VRQTAVLITRHGRALLPHAGAHAALYFFKHRRRRRLLSSSAKSQRTRSTCTGGDRSALYTHASKTNRHLTGKQVENYDGENHCSKTSPTRKLRARRYVLSSLVRYQPLRSSVHETSEAGQRTSDFARLQMHKKACKVMANA
jgi:hypothetical protein